MGAELTETRSTKTIPISDAYKHPIKEFLSRCGLDVRDFPNVRILIETDERFLTTGRHYLPLRIPGHPGWIFESFYRIVQSILIPNTQTNGHRHLVEIEWKILEAPIVDEEPHKLYPFLSAESLCLNCREVFLVDPEKLGNSAVKVVCPNCLYEWKIEVSQPAGQLEQVPLLLDEFFRDPGKTTEKIKFLSSGPKDAADPEYSRYIPVQYEDWGESSSLDLLFEDQKGWIAYSNGAASDIVQLFRSFLNQISLDGLQDSAYQGSLAELDETEIQRKSEITQKIEITEKEEGPTQDEESTPAVSSRSRAERTKELEDRFRPHTDVRMNWDPLTAPTTTPAYRSPARSKKKIVYAASVFVLASLLGLLTYRLFGPSSAEINELTKKETTTAKAIIQAKKLESKATKKPEKKLPLPVVKPKKVAAKPKAEVERPDIIVAPTTSLSASTAVVESSPKQEVSKPQPRSKAKTPVAPAKKLVAKKAPVEKAAATPVVKKEPATKPEASKEPTVSELDPRTQEAVEAGYRQGMLHLKLQQSQKAVQEFERVLRLDPKHIDSYRNLGLAYVYEHRFDEAIKAFESYLKLAGNSFDRQSVEELLASLKSR